MEKINQKQRSAIFINNTKATAKSIAEKIITMIDSDEWNKRLEKNERTALQEADYCFNNPEKYLGIIKHNSDVAAFLMTKYILDMLEQAFIQENSEDWEI